MRLKGRAIIGQSGGCTAVINQSLAGVVDAAKRSKNITELLGARYGIQGILDEDFISLSRQPQSLINGIRGLPSASLGSTRYKLKAGQENEVIEKCRKWNVRFLFLIGGNDTADTVFRVAQAADKYAYAMRVIHIPKTIDNDLMETDHCPGYGSVGRFAAITTQEASLDTKAMAKVDPVKIIELMGRNSGWIVAASALLKQRETDAPHLILVPEIPFEEGKFLARVDGILSRVGHCVVVIAETIRDLTGQKIGARKDGIMRDAFGHQYVEGTSLHLMRLVESHLKVRARYDKPGTIQRMSMPYISSTDQAEAYQAGQKAVQWADQGLSGVMVAFKRSKSARYKIKYVPVALEKVPNKERYLPMSYLNAEKTNISTAFKKYALPLIGPNLPEFPCFKPYRARR